MKKNSELENLKNSFLFGGIILIILGLVHYNSSSQYFDVDFNDFLINTVLGFVSLGCFLLIKKKSILVIALVIGWIIISLTYSWTISRGFNFPVVIAGTWFLYTLIKNKEALTYKKESI